MKKARENRNSTQSDSREKFILRTIVALVGACLSLVWGVSSADAVLLADPCSPLKTRIG